jgi:transposase
MSSRTKARAKRKAIAAQAATAQGLPVLRADVAGIDVGSIEHWVGCPPKPDGSANVQSFGTTTRALEQLADWLQSEGIKSVAMESTGVYWIPLYELLESRGLEVLLANAKQLANVPGRKTDMSDCQWLQLLHSCGLLRGSFRPSEEVCQLRALMRECSNLIEERGRKVLRMQKALDQMNVQVHRAVTDITGTTGMDIIRAIVDGERDPLALAGLRDKRCSKSVEEFAEHLRGTWREEHL